MPLVCLTCGDQLYGAFSASGLPPATGSTAHDLPSASSTAAAAADAASTVCADTDTAAPAAAAPTPIPTPTPLLPRSLPPANSRGAHPQLSASLFLRHPLAASSPAALHATQRQSDASASRESGGTDVPGARVASSSASSSVSVALSENCSLAAALDAPAPAKDSPTAGTGNSGGGGGGGAGGGDGTPLHQRVRPLARSGSSSGNSSFAYLGSPAHGGAPATPTPAVPAAARGAMPHMQSCESFVDLQAACPATPVAAAAANGPSAAAAVPAAAPNAAATAATAHETSPTDAVATPTTAAPAAASVFQRAVPLPLQERALKNTLFYQKMLLTRHVARLGAREVPLPGPLCVMCRDAVLKQPLQNAREAERDEATMHAALDRALACSPPDEGETVAAEAEAADVEKETAMLRAELLVLDVALAEGAEELRSVEAAAEDAEQATDALLRTAAAAAHHAAAAAIDEEESEENRCRYLAEEFAMSSGVGGLPFVFHFECSRIPGSINGHRLGSPYPSDQAGGRQQAVVGWEEVNAALGHLALFVKSVATSIGCKGRRLGFILEGSNSKVAVSGDEGVTYYSLFSKEGSSTTSVDEALVHLNCELSSLAKLVRVGLPYGGLYECDLLIADGHNPLWESSMLKILCNAEALMNGVHSLIQKRKERDTRQPNQEQPPQRVPPSAPKHTPAV